MLTLFRKLRLVPIEFLVRTLSSPKTVISTTLPPGRILEFHLADDVKNDMTMADGVGHGPFDDLVH